MAYTPEEVEWMRKAMGITDEPEPIKPVVTPNAPAVSDAGEYLLLENIACTDADGNVTESYPKLYVKKDVERLQGNLLRFTPYAAESHFEQQANGLFVPSMALSCNVLDIVWQNKDNPEFNQVLMQYKNKGDGYGWHAQNTLVNWGSGQVIHYPSDSDFISDGGNNNINNGGRIPLQFSRQGFKDCTLEDALKNPGMERFVKQLTGLRNPELLVEIGKYFQKPAYVWTSSSNETRAAWLGCYSNGFNLDADSNLDDYDAARGVRSS